jgi:hypothetical protein
MGAKIESMLPIVRRPTAARSQGKLWGGEPVRRHPNTIKKCPVKGTSCISRGERSLPLAPLSVRRACLAFLQRRLPVVSGRTSPAVASTHHYGLARSAPLSASGRLAPRRSQIRHWHNAGLPNQARDPACAESVRRVGLPGAATARVFDD